jgi:hypothetical protein
MVKDVTIQGLIVIVNVAVPGAIAGKLGRRAVTVAVWVPTAAVLAVYKEMAPVAGFMVSSVLVSTATDVVVVIANTSGPQMLKP